MNTHSAVSDLLYHHSDHELAALLVLLRKVGVSKSEQISSSVLEAPSVVQLLEQMESRNRIDPPFTRADVEAALHTVEEWRAKGFDVRPIFSPDYPRNLLAIFNRPPLIFIKGRWIEVRDSMSVAVVGTRKASALGLKRARAAGTRLANAGITVLSGLAAGIDAAAHDAALAAGGRTVAVMGTGIDQIYPKENVDLARRIVESGGGLMTQFFPGQPPTQWTFPMRNVVMSGLSVATLVIEASETSGAKSQARHALQHGRTVFLPKSLVQEHEWARKMTDEGMYGVRAVQIDRPEDIVDRILGVPDERALAI